MGRGDKGRSGTGAVALRPLRPALPHTMCTHMQERTSMIAYMTAACSACVVFTCIEHTHNGRAHMHIHMYMHMHAHATCACACVRHSMPCTHTLYIHTPCTHTPCAHMPRIHLPCAHAHVHVPRVRMRRRRPPSRPLSRAQGPWRGPQRPAMPPLAGPGRDAPPALVGRAQAPRRGRRVHAAGELRGVCVCAAAEGGSASAHRSRRPSSERRQARPERFVSAVREAHLRLRSRSLRSREHRRWAGFFIVLIGVWRGRGRARRRLESGC